MVNKLEHRIWISRKATKQLKGLRRVFKELVCVHQLYSNRHLKDCTFWYTERPQIGLLAAAVWRCDGVAMEEYKATKSGRPSKSGRCDLSIKINAYTLCCEAKFVKTRIGNRTKTLTTAISKGIKAAKKDVQRLEERTGLAICFVRPEVHEERPLTMEAKLHTLINMVFKDSRYDALVWVGTPEGQEPCEGREKWFFPGLLLVVKECDFSHRKIRRRTLRRSRSAPVGGRYV